MMDAKPSEDPAHQMGQIEMLRQGGFGSFAELLISIAQDPAMLVWLDGMSNVRTKPQENFGRELMELFTIGVGEFAETDVYAAARVFTGWNLRSKRQRQPDLVRVFVQPVATRHGRQGFYVPGLQRRTAFESVEPDTRA